MAFHTNQQYFRRRASPSIIILQCSLREESVSCSTISSSNQDTMNIRELMSLLEQTYPTPSTNDKNNAWKKTRRYLYQYRSGTSQRRGPITLSNIQQIILFLQSTFPDNPTLQSKIIQQSPRILGQYNSINSRLVPTVEFLHSLYGGIGDGGIFEEAISRKTDLLLVRGIGFNSMGRGKSSRDKIMDNYYSDSLVVEEYLHQDLHISSSGIAKLKRNHPRIFELSLYYKVKPVVTFLYSLLGHHSDTSTATPPQLKQTKQVAKIVQHYPIIMQLDVVANLEPTSCFLRDACGFTEKELATVVCSTPGLLGLSVDKNLKPTIQFLRGTLIIDGVEQIKDDANEEGDDPSKILLRKCILKHPPILALSLSNLRAKTNYFDAIDNSTKETKPLAGRILLSAPSTYSLSLEGNIIPKIDYLSALWSTASSGECFLSESIREYPQILTLSMQSNIIPTISFYNMTGYVDLNVNGLPNNESSTQQCKLNIRGRYIATSLYNRLLPRWHFLLAEQEKQQQQQLEQFESLIGEKLKGKEHYETLKYNIPTSTSISSIANLPPLHLVAGASDEVFCNQMKLSLTKYLDFKEEAGPRLKFSNQFELWLKTGKSIDLS